MKIDLLLNRVSYDRANSAGDRAFNGWIHGPGSGDPDLPEFEDQTKRLPRIALRKESWGGLFVHGPTGRVFTADHDAFNLLEKLEAGATFDQLSKATDISSNDLKALKERLDQLGVEVPR